MPNIYRKFITFAPTLILEISSTSTKLRDRNTKFNLYELKGVEYYIIVDTEKKVIDIFELINGKYSNKKNTIFKLGNVCEINFDATYIFGLM